MNKLYNIFLNDFRLQKLSHYHIIILIFFVLLTYLLTLDPKVSANVLSRYITVEQLVENHTLSHDLSKLPKMCDMIEINGKKYSSKPPLYSLVMASQAWLVRQVTFLDMENHFLLYTVILRLLNQVIPYILTIYLSLMIASRFCSSMWSLNMYFLSITLGSLPFAYTATLNNHLPTATLCMFLFYLYYQISVNEIKSRTVYFSIGLFAAIAICYEMTSGLISLILVTGAISKNPRRLKYTLVGFLIPMLINFYVIYDLSGSLVPYYFQPKLYQYTNSYWLDPGPGSREPINRRMDIYLFEILFGGPGYFSTSPILFLVMSGIYFYFKNKTKFFNQIYTYLLLSIPFVVIAVWILDSNPGGYYGGRSVGMRHFVFFTPILSFMLIPSLNKFASHKAGKWVTYFLLIMSINAPLYALTYDSFQIQPYSWNIFQHLGKITQNPENIPKIIFRRYKTIYESL